MGASMPNTNQQSTLDQYCQEDGIWRNLIPYLSAADIGSLKRTCKLFNTTLDKLDVAWQPFLNQLHSIDETISVTPQRGQTIKEAFFAAFDKVKTRQLAEIAFLREKHPGYIFKDCPQINAIGANQPLTLSDLTAISAELDAVNSAQITDKYAYNNSNRRGLLVSGVTRFPKALIDNPEHEMFWRNLHYLDLRDSFLHTLPSNINKLQALITLTLPDNQLTTLPGSICDIQSLTELDCQDNQLKALPNSIGKLQNMNYLYLQHNQLEALPSSIGELQNLKNLNCSVNQLTVLPASLTTRFGEPWASFTLASQRRPVEQAPVVEDVAPTLLVKRKLESNQNAKRQRISPREIDSLQLDERWLPSAEKRNSDGKQSLPKRRK